MKESGKGALYAYPMGLWFTVFFVLPVAIIVAYSFMSRSLYGGVEKVFSLASYVKMFRAKYALIFLRTLKISVISTIIIIALALPASYAIARSRKQTLFLFLIIIPFWTNSLIRIFAWMSILSYDGALNSLLIKMHLTSERIPLLYNQWAVVLVSVYMFLPYAILPIFTAIDRFDFSLLEAAYDLGASKSTAMRRVMLPGIRGGIRSAVIFTFVPIFGSYTVPLLVGGMDSYMLGNIIVDQVQKTRNWPLACSFSMLITLLSLASIVWVSLLGHKMKKKQDNFKGLR